MGEENGSPKLVKEKLLTILCIQETKLEVIDDLIYLVLWGENLQCFSYHQSIGVAEGILILWDASEVELWDNRSLEHALIIQGHFLKEWL